MIAITRVAPWARLTAALNNKLKIIKGNIKMIRVLMVKLMAYTTSLTKSYTWGSSSTTARITKIRTKDILRNISHPTFFVRFFTAVGSDLTNQEDDLQKTKPPTLYSGVISGIGSLVTLGSTTLITDNGTNTTYTGVISGARNLTH
jgi:hypothetical protein